MANYDRHSDDFSASRVVSIINTENRENYTVYEVRIHLGHTEWTVTHRYSEFYELHEKLVSDYKLDKKLLPPKKYFGKQSESFIKKRQKQLEIYLQTLLRNFVNVPPCLSAFLNFSQFEIHGVTQELASQLFYRGDQILASRDTFNTTPLQLYSLCTRLQQPHPTCDTGNATQDIGHILDFFTRLQLLCVEGSTETIGTSNIIKNQLAFHLQNFKSLEKLKLVTCNPSKITGVEHVKKSVRTLQVHNSLKALKDLLLIDIGFGQWLAGSASDSTSPAWHQVTTAIFRSNEISYIDESVKLLPRVCELDLSHNKLHEIQELQHLLQLTHVNLSYNNLRSLQALHTKFGNIKCLQLAGNSVQSLQGFSKLYSLESLDVSNNDISHLVEVSHLSSLPCIESLDLRHNPVTSVLDYRTKVLEVFKDRAKEVKLDREKSSQKELDTVAVLLAIQKSKQTRGETTRPARKVLVQETSISENPGAQTSSTSQHLPDSDTEELTEVAEIADETLGDEESEEFRQEVERIQAQGGTAWLTLLNQMQRSQVQEHVGGPSSPKGQAHSYKYQYEDKPRDRVVTEGSESSNTEESSLDSSDESPVQSHTEATFLLPESMPSKNDATFISHLQVMTPDMHDLGRMSRTESSHRDERPVHLMWAPTIRYTNPSREFPACVYITTENIHIFEVKALTSVFELPQLFHSYCIPLMNVQQVALGYRSLYIRLEEAFVGPHGTFTFLTGNRGKTDHFLDALKLAYRRAVPDLDQYEDPHVVVNTGTEARLKQLLAGEESVDESQVDVLLYMLVNVCDEKVKGHNKALGSRALVVTSRSLYIVKEDFIFYPQTTFSVGPSSHPQFEVVRNYPVDCKISDFQMYDSDSFNTGPHHSLTSNFSATNTSAMLSPNFIGYGTRLTFDVGAGGMKELDIRVSTPNVRNKFLEALTSARSKYMEKSPTKVRFKVKTGEKESDSMESSSGADERKRRKHKSKSDRKKGSTVKSKGSHQRLPDGDTRKAEKIKTTYAYSKAGNTIVESAENSEDTYNDGNLPLKRESPTGESADNSESVDDAAIKLVASSQEDFLNYTGCTSSDIEDGSSPTRMIRPQTLLVGYPSIELLDHLTLCNENVPMFEGFSDRLREWAGMTGEEVLNFFHGKLSQIGTNGEEVQHLLWTEMVPYINPKQIVVTCLLLSNKALYFLSDDMPKKPVEKAPWRKHVRYRSDTTHFMQKQMKQQGAGNADQSLHNVSGIVHKSRSLEKRVKVYCVLPLTELTTVHVGLFDQSFRLTGKTVDELHCSVTRDAAVTETFMRYLMSALTLLPSPSPVKMIMDLGGSGSEQDFYRMFRDRTLSRTESLEYVHPSRVKFVYPNDEVIEDLRYVIRESMRGVKPREIDTNILSYLVVYKQRGDAVCSELVGALSLKVEPETRDTRTVVLTEDHLALVSEDYVSYPLPDFATQPPLHKQHVILEVRKVEHLKRVVVSDVTPHIFTLVFVDECEEEISVDAALEYYSPRSGKVNRAGVESPEVAWTLVVRNVNDKERFLKLITRRWEELHGTELSIQVKA